MTTNHPVPTPPPSEPAPSLRPAEVMQALCDAATPGPWIAVEANDGRFYGQPPTFDIVSLDGGREEAIVAGGALEEGGPNLGAAEAADAEFIAAARSALPSLLARLRAAEETLAAVGALHSECTTGNCGCGGGPGFCHGCDESWPCSTRKTLTIGAALAEGASR